VDKSSFNFLKFGSVFLKFLFGGFSESSDLSHKVVEVNSSLDFSSYIIFKELSEIDLEFF